jgi:hypothetical protein
MKRVRLGHFGSSCTGYGPEIWWKRIAGERAWGRWIQERVLQLHRAPLKHYRHQSTGRHEWFYLANQGRCAFHDKDYLPSRLELDLEWTTKSVTSYMYTVYSFDQDHSRSVYISASIR